VAATDAVTTVRVRVPSPLRETCGGAHEVAVAVDGQATVGAVLDVLSGTHPALERRIRDEAGHVRVHVNLFVGADNIRDLDDLATPVASDAEVTVIAAVSGG